MDNKKTFHELCGVAERLGIRVVQRVLKSRPIRVQSGLCTVRGEPRLIVDKNLSDQEKVEVAAEALSGFNLEEIYLVPHLRELLQRYRKTPLENGEEAADEEREGEEK
ncbi:MAG: hypothetical protein AB1921_17435 [Thermodesulfobacteriota bacterium]